MNGVASQTNSGVSRTGSACGDRSDTSKIAIGWRAAAAACSTARASAGFR